MRSLRIEKYAEWFAGIYFSRAKWSVRISKIGGRRETRNEGGRGRDEGEEGRVRRVRRPARAVGRFCVMVLVVDVIIICNAW